MNQFDTSSRPSAPTHQSVGVSVHVSRNGPPSQSRDSSGGLAALFGLFVLGAAISTLARPAPSNRYRRLPPTTPHDGYDAPESYTYDASPMTRAKVVSRRPTVKVLPGGKGRGAVNAIVVGVLALLVVGALTLLSQETVEPEGPSNSATQHHSTASAQETWRASLAGKEVHQDDVWRRDRLGPACGNAGQRPLLRRANPGSISIPNPNSMNNITIAYALRRTPSAQRALRSILDSQKVFNDRIQWAGDRLNLTPTQPDPSRGPLGFPFVRMGDGRQNSFSRLDSEPSEDRIPDAIAAGKNRLHRVWDAHLLVAFWRWMSEVHSVCLELRSESGFIRPGAVLLQDGNAELQRDWLNRRRQQVLEITGNVEAAAPYLFAEAEALQGRFLVEGESGDYPADVANHMDWQQLESRPMSDVALDVVKGVLEPATATKV